VSPKDEETDELRNLPDPPLDQLWAERVRRRAQAALSDERRLQAHPLRRGAVRLWSRVAVPTLLAAACVIYVVWAVRFTEALYH
jgi:hypothetical protein